MIQLKHISSLLLLTFSLVATSSLAEDVVIALNDGRTILGAVDRTRSDMQRLWIRQSSDGVWVSAGFEWENIAAIHPSSESQVHRLVHHSAVADDHIANVNAVASYVTISRTTKRQVRSIAFESTLSNWDRDPAIDGIMLTLYPMDGQRRYLPTAGVVYATLQTWERDQANTKLVPSERWSKHVEIKNVFADGIEIQLPFRKLRDEQKRFLRDAGLLTVRYSVPGMGSFQAEGVVPLSLD